MSMGFASRIVTAFVLANSVPILFIVTRAPAFMVIAADKRAIVLVEFWPIVAAIAKASFERLARAFGWIHGRTPRVCARQFASMADDCMAGVKCPCDKLSHHSSDRLTVVAYHDKWCAAATH